MAVAMAHCIYRTLSYGKSIGFRHSGHPALSIMIEKMAIFSTLLHNEASNRALKMYMADSNAASP